LKHYTGGCGGTGAASHRVLSLINIPAEPVAFTHGQIRFVVERAPLEQMLNVVEPLLPPEPAIDDGLPLTLSAKLALPQSSDRTALSSSRTLVNSAIAVNPRANLASAYLDHNDDPYGMVANPEIPVKEALISKATYKRWFKQAPEGLSEEQHTKYINAHDERVSLRPVQLEIARLPLHMFQYYCWKQDAGKPHGETETYEQYFASKYTVEELEATGFWQRFEQKLNDQYAGCEGVPPMW